MAAILGGEAGLGIDCSGYEQQVYRLNGIRLDRDAHQQAMEGRAVKVAAKVERGDLSERRTVLAIRRSLT